jgi:hypothetical protein
MPPTLEQIALVQSLLPTAALTDYGWTNSKIEEIMVDQSFSPTEAVRYFWLQRVNETSEYLDVNGKPLTQIHAQARQMLEYWDNVLKINGTDATGPGTKRPMTFGSIERVSRIVRRT